jgi:hypothetical protein
VGRIAIKNPRYRTREEIVDDVCEALRHERLSWAAKAAVITDAVWCWTEFDGKLEGCRWWSVEALRSRRSPKQLRHEHVVPKNIVVKQLSELAPISREAILSLFESLCVGAVVTKSEDKVLSSHGLRSRMPDGWDGSDIWARYRVAGIAWVDATSKNENSTSGGQDSLLTRTSPGA